ncbi:MAG: Stf0 family sulfotransferase, partial [Roseinatronobacter sp.]
MIVQPFALQHPQDHHPCPSLAPSQEARYDAAAIRHYMASLAALDEAWERWFEREGIKPLRIKYDD